MNAVIYARYSSHNQTEQSIEGQLRDCYAYAERNGLTVIGEYIDRAISGTTDNREAFQRMIADASKKQFQRILVWKLDRFARNRYDSAMYKHKLKQYGVKVISVMENVGEGDESILLEALLEASAEYYSLDLKKKIKRGIRESILKGQYVGGPVPYGYFVENQKICIHEEEANHLRWMFKEYAAGRGAADIVSELNQKGIRSKKGVQFNVQTLARMFKNRKYIGEYVYNGQSVEGGCPPIIDTETFEKVQNILKSKKRTGGGQARAKVDYLLSGKMYCGLCGSPIIAESGKSKNGTMHHYYSCAKKKKHHSCAKANERKDFLEWYVVEQTLEYVLTPERMDQIADAIIAIYEKEFDKSGIHSLETKIGLIEGEIQNTMDMCIRAKTEAMQNRFLAKSEELSAQKEEMITELSKLRIASKIQYTKEEIIAWLSSFHTNNPDDLFDMTFRERIIDTFVRSVILYDDRLIIYYNIRNGEHAAYIGPDNTEETTILPDKNKKGTRLCSDACQNGGASAQASEHFYIIGRTFFGLSTPIIKE